MVSHRKERTSIIYYMTPWKSACKKSMLYQAAWSITRGRAYNDHVQYECKTSQEDYLASVSMILLTKFGKLLASLMSTITTKCLNTVKFNKVSNSLEMEKRYENFKREL